MEDMVDLVMDMVDLVMDLAMAMATDFMGNKRSIESILYMKLLFDLPITKINQSIRHEEFCFSLYII